MPGPQKTLKCSRCGLSFPKETIKKISGKNYCESCFVKRTKELEDYKELKDTIQNYLSPENSDWPLISKQIKEFHENYDMTYRGLTYTFKYIFEYREVETKFDLSYGISFVSSYYPAAQRFFKEVWRLKGEDVDTIEDILNRPTQVITLKRSDLIRRDQEFEEKRRKILGLESIDIDSIDDDELELDIDDILFSDDDREDKKGWP